MNPEDLLNKTKEELIAELEEFNLKYDDVMANLVMIREELLARLKDEKKDGEIIGEYQISKRIRTTYKTTLEQAEELGAVTKAPDKEALKRLDSQGVEIPGKVTTTYLSVRKLQQDVQEK